MEKSQELALTQMRKSVEKLGFSTEKYGDPTLMRFLIARSMDTEKSSKMFVQWLKWRSSFVPNGFISESEVPEQLEARKVFLQGSSKSGYPVLIVKGCKHFPPKDHLQFKKFVVYLLDKTIASSVKGRETGTEKLIGILDFQHITYKNVDARGLITGFQFLQGGKSTGTYPKEMQKLPELLELTPQRLVPPSIDFLFSGERCRNINGLASASGLHFHGGDAHFWAYFPERLAKCYLLNMPRFFVSVWRMVSRFIEKATLEKIVIVTNEGEKKSFVEEVGEEAVPIEYGGKAKLTAVQDVEVAPLEGC